MGKNSKRHWLNPLTCFFAIQERFWMKSTTLMVRRRQRGTFKHRHNPLFPLNVWTAAAVDLTWLLAFIGFSLSLCMRKRHLECERWHLWWTCVVVCIGSEGFWRALCLHLWESSGGHNKRQILGVYPEGKMLTSPFHVSGLIGERVSEVYNGEQALDNESYVEVEKAPGVAKGRPTSCQILALILCQLCGHCPLPGVAFQVLYLAVVKSTKDCYRHWIEPAL